MRTADFPPPRAHSVAGAVLAAVGSMGATLAVAQALAESRRAIDLTGLDAEMAALCAAVAILPPAEARTIRMELEELLRRVDRLRASLPRA